MISLSPVSGLKILLVCFESQLNSEWFRIARTIREMGSCSGQHPQDGTNGATGEEPLWKFLDFVAMHRSPLYSLLLPFIRSGHSPNFFSVFSLHW